MSTRNRKRLWNTLLGVLLVLTLCFIWGNSLLSRENSAAFSGKVVELLTPIFSSLSMEGPDEHVIRKLAHFTEYAILGLELAALFFINRGRSLKSIGYSALCALAAASADETGFLRRAHGDPAAVASDARTKKEKRTVLNGSPLSLAGSFKGQKAHAGCRAARPG